MYGFPDACALLEVHRVTLWRWLSRAKIELIQSELDKRFRYLKDEDVQRLAREHRRVVAQTEVARLAAEVARLSAKIEKLEK